MSNVFKAISFTQNEVISEPKVDAVTDNMDYLYRYTPRAIYTLPGLARNEGIKMASGRALITARSSDSAIVTVSFGNYFSNGCQPNITTGIVSDSQTKIFCVVNGIGVLIPDYNGFQIEVNINSPVKSTDVIAKSFYVTWQAMGY